MTLWQVVSLVLAVPVGLSGLLLLTARIESRYLAPEERAEKLHGVLRADYEPNEVEEVAAGLVRQALPAAGPWRRTGSRPGASRPGVRGGHGRGGQGYAPRVDSPGRVA